MDYQLFKWINGFAGQNEIIDNVMIFFSSYIMYLFIVMILIFLFIKKTKPMAIIGLGSLLISLCISQLIPFIHYKNRPFVDFGVNLLIEKNISSSFPSDQAVIVFACAFTVAVFSKAAGIILFMLASIVAFSRIYVGHHYPFDVMASLLIAIIAVAVSSRLFYKLTSKKKHNSITY